MAAARGAAALTSGRARTGADATRTGKTAGKFSGGGEAAIWGKRIMSIVYNILLLVLVFVILKTLQLIFDFSYTTYKSVTIHKNWEHAFNPGLSYRLKRGLLGDIVYFIAGIVVAVNADWIRSVL
jgi:hypothetical protein